MCSFNPRPRGREPDRFEINVGNGTHKHHLQEAAETHKKKEEKMETDESKDNTRLYRRKIAVLRKGIQEVG